MLPSTVRSALWYVVFPSTVNWDSAIALSVEYTSTYSMTMFSSATVTIYSILELPAKSTFDSLVMIVYIH